MQIGSRTLVLNPVSGDGRHADRVPRLARARGFEVWRTEEAGDAVGFGRRAAEEGVGELAVCGGDGTVNEVLCGLADAGGLEAVTVSVIPAGTANLLAGFIGIDGIDHALELADTGPSRRVDLGFAGERPFAVSCIAGLPAEASTAASSDLKARLGPLAFVLTGLREAFEFEGLSIELEAADGTTWSGDAICLLVGNARRFVGEGGQGDMEDGRFDVAIVEEMPTGNLAIEAVQHRLLGSASANVHHLRTDAVEVACREGDTLTFSRDGELSQHSQVSIRNRPRTLELTVGPGYDPHPPTPQYGPPPE